VLKQVTNFSGASSGMTDVSAVAAADGAPPISVTENRSEKRAGIEKEGGVRENPRNAGTLMGVECPARRNLYGSGAPSTGGGGTEVPGHSRSNVVCFMSFRGTAADHKGARPT